MPTVQQLLLKYTADVSSALAGQQALVASSKATTAAIASEAVATEARLTASGTALTAGLTVPLVAVGSALLLATRQTGQFAEHILNMSQVTDLSTTYLQQLRLVAGTVGVEFEGVTNTVQMLQRKLMGVENDSGMASESLQRLGIDIHDSNGALVSMNVLFPEVLAKLQEMPNHTERNTVAMQLFGRQFRDIGPILGLTKTQMEEYSKAAGIMTVEQLKAAEDYQRVVNQLGLATGAMSREIGSALIPVLQDKVIPVIKEDVIPAIKDIVLVAKAGLTVFTALPVPIQAVAVGFLALAAVIGPAQLVWARLISTGTMLQANYAKLTGAILGTAAATDVDTAAKGVNVAATSAVTSATIAMNAADLITERQVMLSCMSINARTAFLKAEAIADAEVAAAMRAEAVAAAQAGTAMGIATTAARGFVASLAALSKFILPVVALVTVANAVMDIGKAFSEAGDRAEEGANKIEDSETRIAAHRHGLDTKYPAGALESGAGLGKLLAQQAAEQRGFDEAGRQSTWYKTRLAGIEDVEKRPINRVMTWFPGVKWFAEALAEVDEIKAGAKAAEARVDEAQKMLSDTKAKLLGAGYDVRGMKLPTAAILEDFNKEAYQLTMAGYQAAMLGDKSGEEWAKIQANYYRHMAENQKKANEDTKGEFDKVQADSLAVAEFRAAKAQFNAKQETDARKKGIVTALKIREMAHEDIAAGADANIARAKLQGDELGAAIAAANKAYDDAVFESEQKESDTGKYRYSPAARNSMVEAAEATRNQAINEARKTANLKFIEDWKASNTLTVEVAKSQATAAGDTVGTAMADIEVASLEDAANIYAATVEGKSASVIAKMTEIAVAKRTEAIRKVREDAARKAEDQAREAAVIGIQTVAAEEAGKTAGLRAGLETGVVNPVARIAVVAQIAELERSRAYSEAQADLISKQKELNDLKREHADIGLINAKADAIQVDYLNKVHAAERDYQKTIQAEAKAQAEGIIGQVNAMRGEEDQVRRLAEEEERRRRSAIRMTTAAQMGEEAALGGMRAMFGTEQKYQPIPNAEKVPPTEQETLEATRRLVEQNDRHNELLAAIQQALSDLRGSQLPGAR